MTQPAPSRAAHDRLRQQWLQHAEAVFELMFDADQQEQLITFSQREERACALSREMACWLLEQHTGEDAAVRPSEPQPPACPKCGQPGQRRTLPEEPLPKRQVTCQAGEVTLAREQWRCKTCRVSFFPSGPQTPVGDRRL